MTERALPTASAPAPCPGCGCTGTVQASASLGALEPGDLVICLVCSAICVVTIVRQLRIFTMADLTDYTLDDLAQVSRIVNELRGAYAQRN